VVAALNAANRRDNVAVAIPTEAAPKLVPGTAISAGFVAPPRTISDITAILDSEKPDLNAIEKWKANAEAMPTGKERPKDLSRFYFDRAAARSQLGRVAEAISDASKAVEVGRNAIDANMMGRVKQFLAVQYSNAGDPKKALEFYQQELRETNVPGAKGYQFAANRLVCYCFKWVISRRPKAIWPGVSH
jgi:tetratricopeptide (TPR) repeat protein